MPFDISTWKEQLKTKLPGWRTRMQAGGVSSVYFFLAASSLLPVLQAAQGGDWSALFSLSTVIGTAVSTSLLSNMLQKFKDKSDAEIAQTLKQEAGSAPELKGEIDALLEKLDTLREAELCLSDGDKRWFVDVIKQELAGLKSGAHNTANLTGDGAIAQGDHAMAGGAGSVMVGGNVTGDIIASGATKIVYPNLEAEKQRKALEGYLLRLSRACLSLPLAALGGEEIAESEVTLDKVYIELNTTSLPTGQTRRFVSLDVVDLMTALESAGEYKRLALLGDPGSGKSTFVKKLLAWQASACLGKANPPAGFAANLLPILVNLRDLAPRLVKLEIKELPAPKRDDQLVKAVWELMRADLGQDCADFQQGLHQALKSGQCLLALDGLDEVPQDLRGRVRLAVDALLKRYDPQRIIVTCRLRSYAGEAVLPQFISRSLAPFTEQQIEGFVQGWYNTQRELGRFNETQTTERIADLIGAASQADLRELSSNPMLLTTMAIIHQREVGLPRERVRLYALAVEVLLRSWQKHKVGDAALAEFLKNDLKLRSVMESLAYAAHRASTQSGGTGTLLRKDAIELLEKAENLGSLQLAGEFLDYVDQRAGLLLGYGGELSKPTAYSFPHRTFQEYLAGAYLAGRRDRVRTFYDLASEGDGWDLAAQLAFEELFYNRRAAYELLDLAYQLGSVFKPGEQNERAFLWAGQISALLGRETLERDNLPSGGRGFVEKLLLGLVQVLGGGLVPLKRAEAGRVLARLGDPRSEVLTCEHMVFCHVPAGPFLYGDDKKEVNVPAEFWIGQYPVTNAQYRKFVLAGGYAEVRYWQEAIKEKLWQAGRFKGRIDKEFRAEAVDYGEPYNLSNHPVVGITWYEAQAFAHWLSGQLPVIGSGWQVIGGEKTFQDQFMAGKLRIVLPSELQWEKAARGTDGRDYPWGEEADPNRANYDQTGINTTNAVGCFPGGASPYDTLEMSGNVWEWTATLEHATVHLRGGAFNYNQDRARCAPRSRYFPNYWNSNFGFRVVLSPVLLS